MSSASLWLATRLRMKSRSRGFSRSIASEICWSCCAMIQGLLSAPSIYSYRRMSARNIVAGTNQWPPLGAPITFRYTPEIKQIAHFPTMGTADRGEDAPMKKRVLAGIAIGALAITALVLARVSAKQTGNDLRG